MPFEFDNSYARLPRKFYTRQNPVPVSAPSLIRINHALAEKLDIDPIWLESEEGISTVTGNKIPIGGDPIATVYAGHQFGGWSPQLGDGRAILLGEVLNKVMNKTNAHIIAMSGSYFRGDNIPVLLPEDEMKFTPVTYNYYEQLNGYKYLKSLNR